MSIEKSFRVFGDPVDILLSANTPGAAFSSITQLCEPGGGPPPHMHLHEDELFFPVDGSTFEIFNGAEWLPLPPTGIFSPRGSLHAFRNAGTAAGKILIIVSSPSFPEYLEAISTLQMPQDLDRLISISDDFGLSFPLLDAPAPNRDAELTIA